MNSLHCKLKKWRETLQWRECTQQSTARIKELNGELKRERERKIHMASHCEKLTQYDAKLVEKGSEIAALKTQLETERRN